MLSKWSLENFKSFSNVQHFDFAPLTILCGANSSGKSSVIQSILLVRQTMQHAPSERTVALNGPLLRLGTFSDLLNDQAANRKEELGRTISLGWTIEDEVSASEGEPWAGEETLIRSECHFVFDNQDSSLDRETQELQPSLRSSRLSADFRSQADGSEHKLLLGIARSSGQGRKLQYQSTSLLMEDIPKIRVVTIDEETSAAASTPLRKGKIVSCTTEHFLPSSPIIRFDRNEGLALRIAAEITGERSPLRNRALNVALPDKVLEVIARAISGAFGGSPREAEVRGLLFPVDQQGPSTSASVINRLRELPPSTRRALRAQLAKSTATIRNSIYNAIGPNLTLGFARVPRVSQTNAEIEDFFRFSIRYLGPLRADPSPLYPLQASASPTDVGPKGELTAATLHLNAKRTVEAASPPEGAESQYTPLIEEKLFLDAVQTWLSYIGVAEEIVIVEQGKLGHELRVRASGSQILQDLTNVGVGVSQVLPIVVSCLLADRGATIILEQPELHLNPAVQGRLADLFIAMTALGKQVILETHSEHIIERLRLRIVEDQTDILVKNSAVFFFEMNKGSTKVKPVEINSYGAIPDWPAGFFDQSQLATEQIVLKALRRRNRLQKKGMRHVPDLKA